MKPKVIIHNAVSIDGEIRGFDVDMGLHYKIAGTYKPDIHLVGSQTFKQGIKQFVGEIPKETEQDFYKAEFKRGDKRPYWVIVDSRGSLRGLLHILRRYNYCKDAIILVCKTTPKYYLKYLKERNYTYIIAGDFKVDFKKAFTLLQKKYRVKTILSDAGPTLNSLLLEKGIVDQISMLIVPVIVGKKDLNVFQVLKTKVKLELKSCKNVGKGYAWLVYKVIR
jgi:2,5-diamino-6-(ribosylamino)-4(3H)-pyrimidinone 5'-phosphate reductase